MQWKHILDVALLYVRSNGRLYHIFDQNGRLAVMQYLILGHAWQQEIGDAAVIEFLHAAGGGHFLELCRIGQTKQPIQAGRQIQILFGLTKIEQMQCENVSERASHKERRKQLCGMAMGKGRRQQA